MWSNSWPGRNCTKLQTLAFADSHINFGEAHEKMSCMRSFVIYGDIRWERVDNSYAKSHSTIKYDKGKQFNSKW